MIGVCIKYFHRNYGGMLQAYATIKMLESRGLEYELIQYEKKRTPLNVIRSLPRLLNSVLLNDKYEDLLKKIGKKKNPEFAKNDAIRQKAFDKFKENNFINLSSVFVGYDDLCKGAKRYLAVITGSDQLWSPAGLPTNYYNLMFVPDDIRKISYAS
ncbi:MAG: polysaccharide pyruvyl transferase family protein, partial [Oscillospiraceae bacterium]